MQPAGFDTLSPQYVVSSVEQCYGLSLDGTLTPYSSYVNRVYGVHTDDGDSFVVKFYRPGRWTLDAIEEEHEFVTACAAADLPVVAPIADEEGYTVNTVEWEEDGIATEFTLALYPKRAGRGFDAERPDDWFRLGSLAGRIHRVGALKPAKHRLKCTPDDSTATFLRELQASSVVHPDISAEFFELADRGLASITPLFVDVPMQRLHGDFHRGNILERGEEGLLLIDFDDMMMGPVVQDLWLLLPDRLPNLGSELTHLLSGYEQFADFDPRQWRLVEPLRFMRMIYYLAWQALQARDKRFVADNPGWGSKGFWIRETEDLRVQVEVIEEELRG